MDVKPENKTMVVAPLLIPNERQTVRNIYPAQIPEIKKMKQGMSYTCKEKTIILNVFKYFRTQFPDKCVTDLVRRTAGATGCSEKSVFQFRKEEASVEGFKEPSRTKVRKNLNINSRDIKYDNSMRNSIRNIIYDLQYKSIPPSLNTILKQINAKKNLPNFSVMTLRRLMLDMGFSYQKNGNKSILVEHPDSRLCDSSQLAADLMTAPDMRLQGICGPPPPHVQVQPQQHVLSAPQPAPMPPPHMMHQGPPPPHLPPPYHQMQHLSHGGGMRPPNMHPPHHGPPPSHLTPWTHISTMIKQDMHRHHTQHHVSILSHLIIYLSI